MMRRTNISAAKERVFGNEAHTDLSIIHNNN
jgi:hypothetical protein